MTLRLTSDTGNSIGSSISKMLGRIMSELNDKSGKIMTDVMTKSVKTHVAERYPGSQHYSPNKV